MTRRLSVRGFTIIYMIARLIRCLYTYRIFIAVDCAFQSYSRSSSSDSKLEKDQQRIDILEACS